MTIDLMRVYALLSATALYHDSRRASTLLRSLVAVASALFLALNAAQLHEALLRGAFQGTLLAQSLNTLMFLPILAGLYCVSKLVETTWARAANVLMGALVMSELVLLSVGTIDGMAVLSALAGLVLAGYITGAWHKMVRGTTDLPIRA